MLLYLGFQSVPLNLEAAITIGWKEVAILAMSAWLMGFSWTMVDLLLEDIQCETYCVNYSAEGWMGWI